MPAACALAGPLADRRKVPSSAQDVLDRAMLADRKHDDRHTVFLSKRERGRVHDLQAPIHGFLMIEMVETLGRGILLRIRSIDAIDIGCLENGLALHLGGAKNGRGVCGEIGISRAAGKYDDAPVLKVPKRPLP